MNDLDGDQRLRFGSHIPREGRAVPIGGVEERAFLGLLERWAMRSPDARDWQTKQTEWRKSHGRGQLFTGKETDQQRGNAFAVSIMNRLARRN